MSETSWIIQTVQGRIVTCVRQRLFGLGWRRCINKTTINTNFHIKQSCRRLLRGLQPRGTRRMVISLYGGPPVCVCVCVWFPSGLPWRKRTDMRDRGPAGGVELENRKVPRGACPANAACVWPPPMNLGTSLHLLSLLYPVPVFGLFLFSPVFSSTRRSIPRACLYHSYLLQTRTCFQGNAVKGLVIAK